MAVGYLVVAVWRLSLVAVSISVATVIAASGVAAARENSERPWAERTIESHVEQSEFAGSLSEPRLSALIAAGQKLFSARFTTEDGVGRPMSTQAILPTKRKRAVRKEFSRTAGLDANACSSCHNQPVTGGAGDFSVNVFVSEGFQNTDFDNTDPQFSNERNTNHLFGSGLVELLAREMTADLQQIRSKALQTARREGRTIIATLVSKGVGFGQLLAQADGSVDLTGIEGVDADLVVRPFGQKGVMTSLRQFSINALNHHHGMLATERFGARWTGLHDFDEDGKKEEITEGDVTALVAWQATLAAPQALPPSSEKWLVTAQAGEQLFSDIGCVSCHRPTLPLKSLVFKDPGPFDAAGTRRHGEDPFGTSYNLALMPWVTQLKRDEEGNWLIPVFGDLKRHKIADADVSVFGNELLAQRFVERDVFMTAELWGVASTGPFGHRGDLTTMNEAIRGHGGQARVAREAYLALDDDARDAIIAFLATLVLPGQEQSP